MKTEKFLIIATFAVLLISCGGGGNTAGITAKAGVLDLRSLDLNNKETIELSGEWEFYWNEFLFSEDFNNTAVAREKDFINVPGVWNGHVTGGNVLLGKGYATYRLLIILGKHNPSLAMYFPDMGTAFTVYINGKKVVSEGIAGKTAETTVPLYKPQVKPFDCEGNTIEIILHISNYNHKLGGAWFPVTFGSVKNIQYLRTKKLTIELLLVGGFLLMGFFHFGQYVVRRHDKAVLYLFAACMLIALRTSVMGDRILLYMFPQIVWTAGLRIEYLSYYLAIPVLVLFTAAVLPDEFPVKLKRIIVYISLLFSFVVVLTPPYIFSHTVLTYNIFTFAVFFFCAYLLVRAVAVGKDGSVILLIGLLILIIASVNDILYNMYIINTGYYLPFGFLGLIISQAMYLSKKYARAFINLDIQSRELLLANSLYLKELEDREAAEKELQKSEEKYKSIFNNIKEGIFSCKIDGCLITVNPAFAEIAGYSSPGALSAAIANIKELYVKPDEFESFANKIIAGEIVNDRIETEFNKKSSGIINVLEKIFIVRDNNGRIIHLEGTLSDLTQVRREEKLLLEKEAAETSSRIKSQFLANMSHEIRTPMNAIIGFAELLLSEEKDSEKKEKLDLIHTSGKNLLVIINDILDISKIESGRMEIEEMNFNLHATMDHLYSIFIKKAEGKGIEYSVKIDGPIPDAVSGDQNKIFQILINIIGNAMKFTVAGSVEIDCSYNNGWASIAVKDTGIGIPTDKTENIFSAFIQADSSTSRKYGGTGLGLAISRRLAEMMGGTLGLESVVGEGSVFTLTLPLPEVKEADSGNHILADKKSASVDVDGKLKIIVAEDNIINQKLITAMLKGLGFECDLADNGKLAIDKIKEKKYNLLLLDMQMPVMDGLETISYIRIDENLEDLYVIALTANAMAGDKDKYIAAGCNDYLSKPLNREDLKGKLDSLLEKMNYD